MKDVQTQKTRLQQKKNRIAAEEARLNIKERKMRTRHLIEVGGLVVKAELDHLPTNTLYGALLSLKNDLAKNVSLQKQWTELGKDVLNKEEQSKQSVILAFTEQPSQEIRNHIRSHGLKWNKFRKEWYGYVTDLDSLKEAIKDIEHNIEIIK
jgi:hypothetical protein